MADEKKARAPRKAAAKPTARKTTPKKPVAKKATSKRTPAKRAIAKREPIKATPTGSLEESGINMSNYAEKVASKARSAANDGIATTSEAVSSLGKMIEDSASALDENVGAKYGDYARSAADTVNDMASKLQKKDADELLDDTRKFIRKSPAIAIGAAAAIGFVIARLIKSGSDD